MVTTFRLPVAVANVRSRAGNHKSEIKGPARLAQDAVIPMANLEQSCLRCEATASTTEKEGVQSILTGWSTSSKWQITEVEVYQY